jgi:hypothetical protein
VSFIPFLPQLLGGDSASPAFSKRIRISDGSNQQQPSPHHVCAGGSSSPLAKVVLLTKGGQDEFLSTAQARMAVLQQQQQHAAAATVAAQAAQQQEILLQQQQQQQQPQARVASDDDKSAANIAAEALPATRKRWLYVPEKDHCRQNPTSRPAGMEPEQQNSKQHMRASYTNCKNAVHTAAGASAAAVIYSDASSEHDSENELLSIKLARCRNRQHQKKLAGTREHATGAKQQCNPGTTTGAVPYAVARPDATATAGSSGDGMATAPGGATAAGCTESSWQHHGQRQNKNSHQQQQRQRQRQTRGRRAPTAAPWPPRPSATLHQSDPCRSDSSSSSDSQGETLGTRAERLSGRQLPQRSSRQRRAGRNLKEQTTAAGAGGAKKQDMCSSKRSASGRTGSVDGTRLGANQLQAASNKGIKPPAWPATMELLAAAVAASLPSSRRLQQLQSAAASGQMAQQSHHSQQHGRGQSYFSHKKQQAGSASSALLAIQPCSVGSASQQQQQQQQQQTSCCGPKQLHHQQCSRDQHLLQLPSPLAQRIAQMTAAAAAEQPGAAGAVEDGTDNIAQMMVLDDGMSDDLEVLPEAAPDTADTAADIAAWRSADVALTAVDIPSLDIAAGKDMLKHAGCGGTALQLDLPSGQAAKAAHRRAAVAAAAAAAKPTATSQMPRHTRAKRNANGAKQIISMDDDDRDAAADWPSTQDSGGCWQSSTGSMTGSDSQQETATSSETADGRPDPEQVSDALADDDSASGWDSEDDLPIGFKDKCSRRRSAAASAPSCRRQRAAGGKAAGRAGGVKKASSRQKRPAIAADSAAGLVDGSKTAATRKPRSKKAPAQRNNFRRTKSECTAPAALSRAMAAGQLGAPQGGSSAGWVGAL